MTTPQKYNGWKNYETWNVKLWIDNDQGEQEFWNEQAKECFEGASYDMSGVFSQKEHAMAELSQRLKSHYDDNMHELGIPQLTGFYADLLNAALSDVNWDEIAEVLIEDLEK